MKILWSTIAKHQNLSQRRKKMLLQIYTKMEEVLTRIHKSPQV